MCLVSPFVRHGFFVMAPNLQPAQNGGLTLARDFGISPSSARSLRSEKGAWPRRWCHRSSSICGSVAVHWGSCAVISDGAKSKVRGPCRSVCIALNFVHSPHLCLPSGWIGHGASSDSIGSGVVVLDVLTVLSSQSLSLRWLRLDCLSKTLVVFLSAA